LPSGQLRYAWARPFSASVRLATPEAQPMKKAGARPRPCCYSPKLVHRDDLAAFPLEHREARGGKVAVLAIGQLADCGLDRLAILQRGSHRGRIVSLAGLF